MGESTGERRLAWGISEECFAYFRNAIDNECLLPPHMRFLTPRPKLHSAYAFVPVALAGSKQA